MADTWVVTHPANVKVGDITPAGVVEEVELFGNLAGGIAALRIGGVDYSRSYLPHGWVDVKKED